MLAFSLTTPPSGLLSQPLLHARSPLCPSIPFRTRVSHGQSTFTHSIKTPSLPRHSPHHGPTMEVATHHVPTLYHVPWFCSSVPYQLVLELAIPPTSLDVITITEAQLRTSSEIEFLSPRRLVPFIAFPDGSVLLELGAIVLYMCETFDTEHTLHPAPGDPRRPRFFQGVVYAVAEAYRAVMDVFRETFGKADSGINKPVVAKLRDRFSIVVVEHLVLELEEQGRMYYLGDEFSAVDILFGYILMTAKCTDAGLLENEFVREYHDRIVERPAYKELFSRASVR